MQRFGKAFIKIGSELLETLPGASINIGGVTRTPVNGSNKHLGFSEQVVHAEVECEISLGPGTKLKDLAKVTDATITFECDTGQTYMVRNAFLVDPPKTTEGEGGKTPLKFAGQPAEEV